MKDPHDFRTGDLFSTDANLQVTRLNREDVIQDTDNLKMLSELILRHEISYPSIDKWLKKKVLPGIKSNERVAYIGTNNGIPVVSAVLKCGAYSKICHLNIDERFQDQRIGDLFFTMMVLDAKRRAQELHFTLPESLWSRKRGFFEAYGFDTAHRTKRQYRKSADELRSSAPFRKVWAHAIEKLPKIVNSLTKSNTNIFNGILLSIKPRYVEKLEKGEKVVEIRKRFSAKWQHCRTIIYSSNPMQAIYGYATIDKITKGTPEAIWIQYQKYIGGTKQEYNEYTRSSDRVYAIFLKDFQKYQDLIHLDWLSYLMDKDKEIRPPQSYISLERNVQWTTAVAIAELLHKRFLIHTNLM